MLKLNWFNRLIFKGVAGIYKLVFHLDKEQASLLVESMLIGRIKDNKGGCKDGKD